MLHLSYVHKNKRAFFFDVVKDNQEQLVDQLDAF